MIKKSITVTEQQDEWIRALLIEAEESIKAKGYSEKSPEEMLAAIKEKARQNGIL